MQMAFTSSDLVEAAPTLKPFFQFVRRSIGWFALLSMCVQPSICALPPEISPDTGLPIFVRNQPSSLFSTNSEAHQVTIGKIPPKRDYDPARDLLYFDENNFYNFCLMCRDDDWPSAVQHLALALPVAERGLWLPIAMQRLSRLETVSIVYPKGAGKVDRLERVTLPEQTSRVLRKLADDEMKSLRIKANFVAETHSGWHSIAWNKTVSEHLDLVKEELTLYARSYKPLCWDDDSESLKLTFEARCSEPGDEDE